MVMIADADLAFPVLAFRTGGSIFVFPDLKELTVLPIQQIKLGWWIGTELVDANLATWRISKVHRKRLHLSYERLFLPTAARVDYDLEAVPETPLAALKARVVADIHKKPTLYCNDCCHPEDDIPELEAQVAAAVDVAQLCAVIDPPPSS